MVFLNSDAKVMKQGNQEKLNSLLTCRTIKKGKHGIPPLYYLNLLFYTLQIIGLQ